MPIDPSIYGNIRIPQPIPDPIQQYGQAMQLKGLLRNEADDEAIRQAYQESGGDPDKLHKLLYGSGQYKQAIASERAGLETKKTKSGIQKNDVELIKKYRDEADSLWGTLNPENWKEFRDLQLTRASTLSMPENRAVAMKEVLRMPETFDPEYIKARLAAKQAQRGEAYQFLPGPGGQVVVGDTRRGTGKLLQIPGADGKPAPFVAPQFDPNVKGRLKTAEDTAAADVKRETERKKLLLYLDRAIPELERATADNGLIDKSTGSGIGAGLDWTAGLFGKATEGSVAVGALKPIYDLVLKMVPRFEGPQSDKDTQSYREAAGDLANPNVPNERKKIAGREILRLMKARRNQFISKNMEGTDDDPLAKPAGPTASQPTPPISPEQRLKLLDEELRRRKVFK